VGRPYGYDEERKQILWDIVQQQTEAAGIPVRADVDFGHTDPKLALPIGTPARFDAQEQVLNLLEPATAEAFA
jgi:muramoyltetrapeptide carboxypeptidase LdcA involved in peptidoglycan recycling